MARFSLVYIENKRKHLIAKRKSKLEIMKAGGLRALLHSDKDIFDIDFALKRIEQGQYGICTSCGGLIEEGRLEFKPEIFRCIKCQTNFEKKASVH